MNSFSQTVEEIQDRKRKLRKELRLKRRSLSELQQRSAARALFNTVVKSREFRFAKRIAFTIARDGEISPHLLLKEAQRRRKLCYLPVMSTFGASRLQFRRLTQAATLDLRNRFKIPQPKRSIICPPRALSLVFLPLVAFDQRCNRLGMGKAFYDNTFAFRRHNIRQRPLLLGLAHECQRVETLELNPWDVSLQGIVTDRAWYKATSP